ncbi:metallo-beta-lactamase [Mycobacterium bohemicum DSM 44277]|uniref:MBL fold metallo-hydrolase n=2 Tax=Mycobacterium bohemicum TaxID=56425 RepID=A0A1X1QVS8_MYCBE|nr:MBL fold metallo-hydrolase [Mycobacterium bohemicum]ORU95477.1 MBL fold metallo-hydrolase [Mycobacterium bohemicum]CPR10939.1 metallo-beta-lactamase [Mycobacterium bohemicum DSM 44277]
MTTEAQQFEPVYRGRPGAEAMRPAAAERAEQIAPGLWCSPGLSNAYLLTTDDGRVVVNTGMGFEGPVHRANFDAVDASPVRYIIFTQGHVDHVGGLDSVRDPDTTVVAQANWRMWRDDNERLLPYRASRSAFAFKDTLATGIQAIQRRLGTGRLAGQSVATVDLEFEDSLTLEVGGRRLELISVPGGETTDSLVVWLPHERICLCGNTFGPLFGHIPNLVTVRGDRYRDACEAIAAVERVRELQPELLVTGHFDPIAGAERIDAELTRLREAIRYVHDQTVEGMNAGKDVRTLMREITLPPDREVGQGYGKVAWDVRAIWENYSGWFHHASTTELYPIGFDAVAADIVELAGADALLARARGHLDARRPLQAIHLAELVPPDHPGARDLLRAAHEALLAASENFWETAWLKNQIARNS